MEPWALVSFSLGTFAVQVWETDALLKLAFDSNEIKNLAKVSVSSTLRLHLTKFESNPTARGCLMKQLPPGWGAVCSGAFVAAAPPPPTGGPSHYSWARKQGRKPLQGGQRHKA